MISRRKIGAIVMVRGYNPALRRQRREDCESEASMVYRMRYCLKSHRWVKGSEGEGGERDGGRGRGQKVFLFQ